MKMRIILYYSDSYRAKLRRPNAPHAWLKLYQILYLRKSQFNYFSNNKLI